MDFKKDYYAILGVAMTASKAEIKAAYRKLAMQWHPDKNQGNKEAEEKFKTINEAQEVLLNDISRYKYDEYKKMEEKLAQEAKNEKAGDRANADAPKGRRTYQKKTIIRTEQRIYITGTIEIKYWAEQENEDSSDILSELLYKLHPVTANASITETDIHPLQTPVHFERAYQASELFRSPLPQPIYCKIISSTGEELYALTIHDIRIVNPQLSLITKHEKQSLGTLTGTFYGYVLRINEEEVLEPVTECFGETGNLERKTEDGYVFIRKEYYHQNCTTYWGPWELVSKPFTATKKTSGTRRSTTFPTHTKGGWGCAGWSGIPLLLLFIIAFPKFFLGLLGIMLLLLLFSIGTEILGRLVPVLGLVLLGIALYSAFRNTGNQQIVRRQWQPSYDTLTSSRDPILVDSSSGRKADTLIRHFIRWKDYDSNSYAVNLVVTTSHLKASSLDMNRAGPLINGNSLSPVYNFIEKQDDPRLQKIFLAFDSIQKAQQLDEQSLARMIVSCVQSIPYYLVLSNACNDNHADDEFVSNYLRQCQRECCIGNIPFGLRTPVEFMSDLKGDCDTRSLFLYSLLKRFNIDVALLTSEYYRHAVIAVHFTDEKNIDGLSVDINNRNYYLWETTNTGFEPGRMPGDMNDLFYWTVALLHEKTQL